MFINLNTPLSYLPDFKGFLSLKKGALRDYKQENKRFFSLSWPRVSDLRKVMNKLHAMGYLLNYYSFNNNVFARCPKLEAEVVKFTKEFNDLNDDFYHHSKFLKQIQNIKENAQECDQHVLSQLIEKNAKKFNKKSNEIASELFVMENSFQENWNKTFFNSEITLSKDEVEKNFPISAEYFSQSLKNAKKNKIDGYCLNVKDPNFNIILENCTNREIRKKIWNPDFQSQDKKAANKLINGFTKLHGARANLFGYKNYMDYLDQQEGCADKDQILNFLEENVKFLQPKVKKIKSEVQAFALKNGMGKVEPWDVGYILSKIQTRYDRPLPDDNKYFKYRSTIIKSVKILSKWFGYEYKGAIIPTASGKFKNPNPKHGFWRFMMKDGNREIFLDIAPYFNKKKPDDTQKSCCLLTSSMKIDDHSYGIAHCLINMGLSPDKIGFEQQEINDLWHELGHAFHYMSVKCELPVQSPENFPDTYVELPSQLIEFISKRGWIREKICSTDFNSIPKINSRYWKRRYLKSNKINVIYEYYELLDAIWDIKIQSDKRIKDPIGFRKKLFEKHGAYISGMPPFSPWYLDGYAGKFYCYVLSAVMANYLISENIKKNHKHHSISKFIMGYKENFLQRSLSFKALNCFEDLTLMTLEDIKKKEFSKKKQKEAKKS